MQATPAQEDSSSGSSGLVHASELMASSSGTEVGVEVEEEVEYIEEVVEYEDDEDVEEGEEDEEQQQGTEEESSPADEPKAESEDSPASLTPAEMETVDDVEPAIPSSSLAQELPELSSSRSSSPPEQTTSPGEPSTAVPQPLAAPPGSVHPGGSAGVDLDFKQLEAQAAKVAKEVSQVALDVSSKLTAGFRSAFGGASSGGATATDPAAAAAAASSSGGVGGLSLPPLPGAAAAAGASLTKLAGGLSSWWGSLDPAPQPVRDETAERVAASNKASGELQQLFGLSPEENLVEHFKCKLLQTYACSHNPHTPAIQMAFQGTLYVTDRHTCFCVEERGRRVPFKVPHGQVVRSTRQRPTRKGDLSDVLKLELSSGQWLAFKDFDSGSSLDSALALVEHLTEGS